MQSTGQASTQAVSLVPMQGSAITYAIRVVPGTLNSTAGVETQTHQLPTEPWWHQTVVDDRQSAQGSIPSRGSGHAISSRHQGSTQGNVADCGQAHHPVWGGRGGPFGYPEHYYRDGPRQDGHRRSDRKSVGEGKRGEL